MGQLRSNVTEDNSPAREPGNSVFKGSLIAAKYQAVKAARMADISVLHLYCNKANFHAIFQIAAAGGFADPNVFHYLVNRPIAILTFAESALNQFQRIGLNPFRRRGGGDVSSGQIVETIERLLVQHF